MKKLILAGVAVAALASCTNDANFVTQQFWYTNHYNGGTSNVVDIVTPTTEQNFENDSVRSYLDMLLNYPYSDSIVLDSVITQNL